MNSITLRPVGGMYSELGLKNCNLCSQNISASSACLETIPENTNPNSCSFECRDAVFPTVLLDGLNYMRRLLLLCDVVLVTGRDEHPAHRVVLAAVSPYFRAMFSSHLRESEQLRITLHNIESAILIPILNFIYTSEIKITENNINDLMVAADFLNISSLQNLCCQYLHLHMNAGNCIGIYLSATARNYKELAQMAKRYLLEHFRHIVKEEEFLQLPFTEFKSILESHLLNTTGEGELLETVSKWVEYNPEERLCYLSALVAQIDVWQVPAEKLLAFVNSEIVRRGLKEGGLLSESSTTELLFGGELKLAVEKIMNQRCDSPSTKAQQYHSSFYSKKIRHSYEQEVIMAIGGDASSLAPSSMECFTLGYDGWRCSIPTAVAISGISEPTLIMPPMRMQRVFPAIASADYTIFVIGGISRGKLTESFEHYNVRSNEWIQLADLPVAAHGCGAALSNQNLCVVGGRTESGIEKRAWMYEEGSNEWSCLPPMKFHRVHLGVADLNGLLYAVGGLGGRNPDEEEFLSTVECYYSSLERWISVAPMHEVRAYCGVASVGSYLYAIGGFNGTSWLRSMERYDPLTNQWTLLTPMSIARSAFGTTVCNGRIYIIGGNDGIHLLNTVEKFNPRTNRWHCAQAMQIRRIGLGAATVKIPLKME